MKTEETPAADLRIDPPHDMNAAIVGSFRYWLWLVDGQPEVWHHVPYKRETKNAAETPAHWVRYINFDAIPRMDARQELKAAYELDREWREAHRSAKQ